MTSEIAILNASGVALAADSAVTVANPNGTGTEDKIYNTQNKLFTLSKCHPVGIMIYQMASLMMVPWEVLIKVYRHELGEKSFDSVVDYGNDFIAFLARQHIPVGASQGYVKLLSLTIFTDIVNRFERQLDLFLRDHDSFTPQKVGRLKAQVIKQYEQEVADREILPEFSENDVATLGTKYKDIIDEAIKEVFEALPLTMKQRDALYRIAGHVISRGSNFEDEYGLYAGVVIAGYGDKQLFPALVELKVYNIVDGRLRYRWARKCEIGVDSHAAIIPFAQSNMAFVFMEGIDIAYLQFVYGYLSKLLGDYAKIVIDNMSGLSKIERDGIMGALNGEAQSLLDRFAEDANSYRRERYSEPIITAVAVLPKNELAEMAEALVSLASIKKRVSMDKETVGGPIDVAVISKGDGFIWIKRKHYFQPELNHPFFANYFRTVNTKEN